MKSKSNTIASLLKRATIELDSVSESPRLDAEVLMAHCLSRQRSYLFTWPERSLTDEQLYRFKQLMRRRIEQVPLAYITGIKEFWSLEFTVTEDTLIPRSDTELLVELALDCLTESPGPVLDLGTGSGIIAISIAHELPGIRVDAVDCSTEALLIARNNAWRNHVDVNFIHSDWFDGVLQSDYRLIVSNPPYIAPDDSHLHRNGLQYEPRAALVAASNGLMAIKTIIEQATHFSSDNAAILIEHGYSQGGDVREMMQKQGFQQVTTHRDIEGRERVTLATIV